MGFLMMTVFMHGGTNFALRARRHKLPRHTHVAVGAGVQGERCRRPNRSLRFQLVWKDRCLLPSQASFMCVRFSFFLYYFPVYNLRVVTLFGKWWGSITL